MQHARATVLLAAAVLLPPCDAGLPPLAMQARTAVPSLIAAAAAASTEPLAPGATGELHRRRASMRQLAGATTPPKAPATTVAVANPEAAAQVGAKSVQEEAPDAADVEEAGEADEAQEDEEEVDDDEHTADEYVADEGALHVLRQRHAECGLASAGLCRRSVKMGALGLCSSAHRPIREACERALWTNSPAHTRPRSRPRAC